MKKYIVAGVITVVVAVVLIVCNLPKILGVTVTALHINSDTIRLESNMTKRLSLTVNPEKASDKDYRLISENEFVAVCEGDSVIAVNEGETFVYAVSDNGKVESNKVKVVVSNNIFTTAAKIIMSAMDAQTANQILSEEVSKKENIVADEKDKLRKTEVTKKQASQITETEIAEVPETFQLPAVTEENANEVVYITKSGDKFHSQSCSYARGATAVSRSQAVADGKSPCKKCKP